MGNQVSEPTTVLHVSRFTFHASPLLLWVEDHGEGIPLAEHKKIFERFYRAQAAKAKARGYRTTHNLLNIAYLIAGKLDFALPAR